MLFPYNVFFCITLVAENKYKNIICSKLKPTITVEGSIVEKSDLPSPQKSNYPDCFFSAEVKLHLRGKKKNDNILVIFPGFCNRKLCLEANYQKGDKLLLYLRPYNSLPQALKTVQLADYIDNFELRQFFAVNSKRINKFSEKTNTIQLKNNNRRKIKPDASAMKNEKVQAIRHAAITSDLKRINYLLQSNGNDWNKWNDSLDAFRKSFNSIRTQTGRKYYGKWVGNSFFRMPNNIIKKKRIDSTTGISGIEAITLLNQYCKSRNIDLILVPYPCSYFLSYDLFSSTKPNTGIIAPEYWYIQKQLLKNGVEVLDPLHSLMQQRFKVPLLYYYPHKVETHPIAAANNIVGREIAKRLTRYSFTKRNKKDDFSNAQSTIDYIGSYKMKWPEGNPKFQAETHIPINIVTFKNKKKLYDDNSELLVIGDSFAQYPCPTANVPAYIAYHSYVRPATLIRGNSTPKMGMILSKAGEEIFKNRKVCVWVVSLTTLRGFFSKINFLLPEYIKNEKFKIKYNLSTQRVFIATQSPKWIKDKAKLFKEHTFKDVFEYKTKGKTFYLRFPNVAYGSKKTVISYSVKIKSDLRDAKVVSFHYREGRQIKIKSNPFTGGLFTHEILPGFDYVSIWPGKGNATVKITKFKIYQQ